VSRDLEFEQYCLYCISVRLDTCYNENNVLPAKYNFFKESQTARRAFCSVESVSYFTLQQHQVHVTITSFKNRLIYFEELYVI